ncbi:insulinase family protein [bacterium]|nr:insulinase family protein [bacterium]MBU1073391.1 insulinase family protein [bacterium]MBU1676217.1 insulinase family protein [bacterium]
MKRFLLKTTALLLLALVVVAAAAPEAAAAKKTWEKFKYPDLGEISMPEYERIELDNGMILYLAVDRELPLVQLSATIQAGSIYEPAHLTGLASITGDVLRTGGTAKWTGDEIDEMVENMGASVETWVGSATGGAYLSALTEDADKALEILGQILMHPVFDEDKITLAKTQAKAGISRRNDEPMSIAMREFTKVIFGADHPLARVEEYDTIGSITRDDLLAFHDMFFHPDRMYLVVIGDFDTADMIAKIEATFAGWEKAAAPLPPDPDIPNFPRTVNVAAKEDLTQSMVLMGHKGIRNDHQNYAAIQVANKILGGGFSSRLFNEVRSKRGLAYSTGSQAGTGWRFPGTFVAFSGTKCETTEEALDVMLEQIERMTTEAVSQKELQDAIDGIMNSDVFNYDTKREVLDRAVIFEMYGYPLDFLTTYRDNVLALTPETVLAACQDVWKPGQLSLLVVGNPELFDGDLSKYGLVNDVDITIPEPKLTLDVPAATEETLAAGQALMAKAATAIGGKQLATLKGFMSELSLDLEIQGMPLTFGIEQTIVYPDKLKTIQKTPFGEMAQCLDGDTAWARGPMGVQDLPAEQLGDMKQEITGSTMTLLRDHGQRACQALAQEELDGVICDRVYVTKEDGDFTLFYLDAATGLIVMEQGKGQDPMSGSPVQEKIMYADYKDYGGFKRPSTLTILHDGEHFAAGVLKKFEANPKIADGYFTKPE